jgi:hypothetical protein
MRIALAQCALQTAMKSNLINALDFMAAAAGVPAPLRIDVSRTLVYGQWIGHAQKGPYLSLRRLDAYAL